jgi:hypothetical protein
MRWIVAAWIIWGGCTGTVSARELFQCEPLKGKGVQIRREPTPNWYEDSLGPVEVLLEGGKFFVSVGDYVPPALSHLNKNKKPFQEAIITSSDTQHIIAQIYGSNFTTVYNFHIPTRMLFRASVKIMNFAYPNEPFREPSAAIFVSRCR